MMNTPRPASLTIFCWYLVAEAVWTVLVVLMFSGQHAMRTLLQMVGVSPMGVVLRSTIGALVDIVAATAMLRRRGWGRGLYLLGTPMLLGWSMILYDDRLRVLFLVGVIAYGSFIILLMRQPVSEYFAGVGAPADNFSSTRKLTSVLLLIIGGALMVCWLMLLAPISRTLLTAGVASGFCGLLGFAVIIPAVVLWGRARWASVLGTLFLIVSAVLLLVAVMVSEFTSIPDLRVLFVNVDPAFIGNLIHGSLVFGLVTGIAGGVLVFIQRERDRNTTSLSPSTLA